MRIEHASRARELGAEVMQTTDSVARHTARRRGLAASLIGCCVLLLALVVPLQGTLADALHGAGWDAGSGQCSGSIHPGLVSNQLGPGFPPLGSGSVQFKVGFDPLGLPLAYNSNYDGIALSDLTALSYWTFTSSASAPDDAVFFELNVDVNGDMQADDQLIFLPSQQGTVQLNTWQQWNALDGTWWSVKGLAGMGLGSAGGSLSDYLSTYPSAQIVNDGMSGGVLLGAGCYGSGWATFVGAADDVTIGVNGLNAVYDFEGDGPHLVQGSSGIDQPDLPTFSNLTPAPFSTVTPGTSVKLSAEVTGTSDIAQVTMQLDGASIPVTLVAPGTADVVASSYQSLAAGTHTVTMTATDSIGAVFKTQWDVVVSSNTGDSEWFNADGTPKTDQINATMTSLVQAFRYHLYGQSWDGQAHPEMPTHASTITQAAPLSDWVTNGTFDEAATNATLTSLVQAFRWHFWGISWDGAAHPEMPTHASVVLPPQPISAWFNADGTPKQANISATLQSLVQAFRWHFWGYSWDGQHHFTDMPTHAY